MASAPKVWFACMCMLAKFNQFPAKPPVAEAGLGAASFLRTLAPGGAHTTQISLPVIGGYMRILCMICMWRPWKEANYVNESILCSIICNFSIVII